MIPILFAPLQGYTDYIYRNVHHQVFGGIDYYYTPFVRIEKGEFRRKELRDIEPSNNTVPRIVPQLIAGNPDEMERIVSLFIEKGYTQADINLGCPFPVLAKKHKGSGMLPYPNEVEALLNTLYKFPGMSFSLKMRLGWESADESMILLPLLNTLPVSHITLHPRLGKQQYKGRVDMEGFKAFQSQCTQPLVYNGDILSAGDIDRVTENFPGLSGIMMGRGLLANPALASEWRDGKEMPATEKMKRIKEFHDKLLSSYQEVLEGGEGQLVGKMKTLWEYLLPETDKKLKKRIHKSKDLQTYREAVRQILAG